MNLVHGTVREPRWCTATMPRESTYTRAQNDQLHEDRGDMVIGRVWVRSELLVI